MNQPDFETRIATLEQKLEDLARVVVRQQLAMEKTAALLQKLFADPEAAEDAN